MARYEKMVRKTFDVRSITGSEALCMCPWHKDTSGGHLYVNVFSGLYLCFSCGAKGSLDKMVDGEVPKATTTDLRERLDRMAERKKPLHTYPEGWLRKYAIPHPFWTQERGLDPDIVDLFGLGFDPFSNRATMPLRDVQGRVLGVTFRRLDGGTPKYLNPKGYPIGRHLYGAWLLNDNHRTVAVTEGQVDAIRCWQYGIPAVAAMGARLTPDQVSVLQHCGVRKVVLLLDNDNAGRKGTVAIYGALRGTGISVRSGWYREYWLKQNGDGTWRNVKDPDELTRPRLRKMYHSAVNMLEWVERSGFDPDAPMAG